MKPLVAVLFIAVTLFASRAPAQDDSAARIVAEGQSTLLFPVSRIAFRFDARLDTVIDSAEAAHTLSEMKGKLEKLLRDLKDGPIETEIGPLTVPPSQSPMGWSAWLRYAPPVTKPGNTPDLQLGEFLKRVRTLGTQSGCRVVGPFFEAGEPRIHEQNAIAAATEQALYKAEAVARALRTRIYTVEAVEIIELKWFREGNPEPVKDEPIATQNGVPCRARVKITYLSAAP